MTPQTSDASAGTGGESDVRETIKQDADRLKQTVGARARQEADSRKGQAVHAAQSASDALGTAAQDLKDNPEVPGWMASALEQAARKIDGLAKHVDGRGVDELGEEIARFARANPATFLIGSAAAGFAAARVLRAGAERKRHGSEGSGQNAAMGTGAQDWPADENIMPTDTGDFAPAYTGSDTEEGIMLR